MHGAVREYAAGSSAFRHRVLKSAAKLRAFPQAQIGEHGLHLQVIAALLRRVIPCQGLGRQPSGVILAASSELVGNVFQQSAILVMFPFRFQGAIQLIAPRGNRDCGVRLSRATGKAAAVEQIKLKQRPLIADNPKIGKRQSPPGVQVRKHLGHGSQFNRDVQEVIQREISDRRALILQRGVVGQRVRIDALQHFHKDDAVVDCGQPISKLDPPSARVVAPNRLSPRCPKRTA